MNDTFPILPVLWSAATLGVVIAAFSFMGLRLLRIAAMVNMGVHDEPATDYAGSRWKMVGEIVFGHRKTLEDVVSGLTHIAFIYGFFILGIGHTEIVRC